MTVTRNSAVVGAFAAAATLAVLVFANFVDVQAGETGGTLEFLVTGAVALGAWLLLFGWYAPRTDRPAAGAVAAGLFGIVSVLAFWSGLPVVLGAAAITLGARARATSRVAGALALTLGAAAIALAFAGTIYELLG